MDVREAAYTGDLDRLKQYVEKLGVDPNEPHKMNGMTRTPLRNVILALLFLGSLSSADLQLCIGLRKEIRCRWLNTSFSAASLSVLGLNMDRLLPTLLLTPKFCLFSVRQVPQRTHLLCPNSLESNLFFIRTQNQHRKRLPLSPSPALIPPSRPLLRLLHLLGIIPPLGLR